MASRFLTEGLLIHTKQSFNMLFSVTKDVEVVRPGLGAPRQVLFALALSLSLSSWATATEITLNAAVEKAIALGRYEELSDAARREADGRLRSARSLPNPSLFYEHESLGDSTGDLRENTVGVATPLGFIWKRSARIDAAESRREIAEVQLEDQRRQIVREVASLFVEHAATIEEGLRHESAHDVLERARRFALAATREGDAPGSLLRRVELSIARHSFEEAEIEARLQEIQSQLAFLVGIDDVSPASGDLVLDELNFTSEVDAREAALEGRPDLKVTSMLLDWRRAELRVARNEGRPSASLQAGYKEDSSGRDGFVVGLSVELPVFDRNEGGAEVAEADVIRAKVAHERARRIVEEEARSAYRQWKQRSEDCERLTAQEPARNAEALLRTIAAGFEAGESSLMEYLDAVETSLEAWEDEIQLRKAKRQAAIELAYATAANIQR